MLFMDLAEHLAINYQNEFPVARITYNIFKILYSILISGLLMGIFISFHGKYI